jgi:hypothetical protein
MNKAEVRHFSPLRHRTLVLLCCVLTTVIVFCYKSIYAPHPRLLVELRFVGFAFNEDMGEPKILALFKKASGSLVDTKTEFFFITIFRTHEAYVENTQGIFEMCAFIRKGDLFALDGFDMTHPWRIEIRKDIDITIHFGRWAKTWHTSQTDRSMTLPPLPLNMQEVPPHQRFNIDGIRTLKR